MDEGGVLEIRTYETDHNRHIEFKNTYFKEEARDLELFFLPFNTSDRESGLPLSYRQLKNMGGLLSYSQGEKEMIFTVSLPKKAAVLSD